MNVVVEFDAQIPAVWEAVNASAVTTLDGFGRGATRTATRLPAPGACRWRFPAVVEVEAAVLRSVRSV